MSLYLCGQAVAGLAAEVGLDARGDAVDGEAGLLQQLRAAAVIEKDVGQAELNEGGGRAAGREIFAAGTAGAAHHRVLLNGAHELVGYGPAGDHNLIQWIYEAQ